MTRKNLPTAASSTRDTAARDDSPAPRAPTSRAARRLRMPSGAGWWGCAVVACVIGLGAAPPLASPDSSGGPVIRVRVLRFVDRSRTIRLPDGRRVPRTLVTVVRYPAAGGPYPLIVFGHGYALTPARYARLLRAWTEAGYVVAAPVFPLGNANAPGGPNESDLVNQPQDMSVVIARMLVLNGRAKGVLGGKVDPSRIAVAGHSDGAETALAVAYDHRYRDRRIRAAIVLSGAALPGMGPFPRTGPPLLAVQGTADTTNCTGEYVGVLRAGAAPEVPAVAARRVAPPAVHGSATAARNRRTRHDRLPRPLPEGPASWRPRQCGAASGAHAAHRRPVATRLHESCGVVSSFHHARTVKLRAVMEWTCGGSPMRVPA